jgi:hypothetical protein
MSFAVSWELAGKETGTTKLAGLGRSPRSSVRIVPLQLERETNVEQALSI